MCRTSYRTSGQGIEEYLLYERHSKTFKDLLARIWKGSAQEHLTMTWTRSCKDLWNDFSTIFTRSSRKDLYEILWDHAKTLLQKTSPGSPLLKIMQGPRREDFTKISRRSPHMDLCKIMQGHLRGFSAGSAQNLFIRTCTRQDLTRIFSRLLRGFHQDPFVRAHTHGHVTRPILCQNPRHSLCEPAQSKCTWTCHKSHCTRETTGKKP